MKFRFYAFFVFYASRSLNNFEKVLNCDNVGEKTVLGKESFYYSPDGSGILFLASLARKRFSGQRDCGSFDNIVLLLKIFIN